VKREVFGTKPPIRAEYLLTEFGKTRIPVLEAIALWGRTLAKAEGDVIEIE